MSHSRRPRYVAKVGYGSTCSTFPPVRRHVPSFSAFPLQILRARYCAPVSDVAKKVDHTFIGTAKLNELPLPPVPVLAMPVRIYAAATFPPLGPERVARRGKRREARVEWSPLPSSLRPTRVEWANRSGATIRPLRLEHLGGNRAPTVGRDGRFVGLKRSRHASVACGASVHVHRAAGNSLVGLLVAGSQRMRNKLRNPARAWPA